VREGRLIALDVGDVRIGVAMSDPLGIIASPHSVIACKDTESDLAAVVALIAEHRAVGLVVGLPLNQNGEVGPQAEKVLAFVEGLRGRVEVEIDTIDERFTSVIAERALIGANVSRKDRKKLIDKIAAQQILQTFLDRQRRGRAPS